MSLTGSNKLCRRVNCRQIGCSCSPTLLVGSLNRDLLSLKSRSNFSDFTIHVREHLFPVHRSILAARSNVFLTMFQQTDSIETSLSTLHLDDHDPVSIDLFLQYLYSDRCLLTEENRAEQLLELADKYHVDSLKLLIEDYFILNKENCLRLFILADRHSAVRLKDSTIKFINQNLTQIFSEIRNSRLDNVPTDVSLPRR